MNFPEYKKKNRKKEKILLFLAVAVQNIRTQFSHFITVTFIQLSYTETNVI